MRICVRLTVFMVKSVISGPIDSRILSTINKKDVFKREEGKDVQKGNEIVYKWTKSWNNANFYDFNWKKKNGENKDVTKIKKEKEKKWLAVLQLHLKSFVSVTSTIMKS